MSAIPGCQHKGKFMVTRDQNTRALIHIYVSAADVGQMSKRLDCNIDSDQSQRAVVCRTFFYVESIQKKRERRGDRREASKQTRYKKDPNDEASVEARGRRQNEVSRKKQIFLLTNSGNAALTPGAQSVCVNVIITPPLLSITEYICILCEELQKFFFCRAFPGLDLNQHRDAKKTGRG